MTDETKQGKLMTWEGRDADGYPLRVTKAGAVDAQRGPGGAWMRAFAEPSLGPIAVAFAQHVAVCPAFAAPVTEDDLTKLERLLASASQGDVWAWLEKAQALFPSMAAELRAARTALAEVDRALGFTGPVLPGARAAAVKARLAEREKSKDEDAQRADRYAIHGHRVGLSEGAMVAEEHGALEVAKAIRARMEQPETKQEDKS